MDSVFAIKDIICRIIKLLLAVSLVMIRVSLVQVLAQMGVFYATRKKITLLIKHREYVPLVAVTVFMLK